MVQTINFFYRNIQFDVFTEQKKNNKYRKINITKKKII